MKKIKKKTVKISEVHLDYVRKKAERNKIMNKFPNTISSFVEFCIDYCSRKGKKVC